MEPFTWSKYSEKLQKIITQPHSIGSLHSENMRCVIGEAGSIDSGSFLRLHLIVDEEDGCIADARFQLFGDSALFGAAEILCSLLLRKTYLQAHRLTSDLIDHEARSTTDKQAFPEETSYQLNYCIEALDAALEQCYDIPIQDEPPPTPIRFEGSEQIKHPNWLELSEFDQRAIIDTLLTDEIRPYIELDAGGVEIVKIEKFAITIAYQGACTSCYSATGSTLNAIDQILKVRIHPDIQVVADYSSLTFAK